MMVDPVLGRDKVLIEGNIIRAARMIIRVIVFDHLEWIQVEIEPHEKEEGKGEEGQFTKKQSDFHYCESV
jgi:hypothetical protein